MTAHSWTTAADVPTPAWSALAHDMRTLLDAWAAAGRAAVTGPDGTGAPVLDDASIAFRVALPAPAAALAVTFVRAAGTGTCTTNGSVTDGLVVAALTRAARHWGALLTWTSDAGSKARAVAAGLVEQLYGADDRAVTGAPALSLPSTAGQVVARAQAAADTADPAPAGLAAHLSVVIAQLTAERDGYATAEALLAPPPPAG